MRVRETVEDLCGGLDGVAVPKGSRTQRVAQRPSRDVRIGDIDVRRIAAAGVGAEAANVVELCHCLRFSARARAGVSLARHDLDGDVAAALLVTSEPHRAGATAPEGPDSAEPAQEQGGL
jgi:hypothetical protein